MGDIINLRRFRKARDRQAAGKAAAVNRVAFGRSKVERMEADAEADKAGRRLDGHRLTDPSDGRADSPSILSSKD